MNQIPYRQIVQQAGKKQNAFAHNISLSQSCAHVYLGPEINALACATAGVEQLDENSVLSAFFNQSAAAQIREMPNPFWMWTLISVVMSQCQSAQDVGERITSFDLQWAKLTMRTSMGLKFDLSKSLTQLTQAQLCSRVIRGVVLLRQGAGDSDEIIFNPLFAPE